MLVSGTLKTIFWKLMPGGGKSKTLAGQIAKDTTTKGIAGSLVKQTGQGLAVGAGMAGADILAQMAAEGGFPRITKPCCRESSAMPKSRAALALVMAAAHVPGNILRDDGADPDRS